jgi:phage terminase small subunit
VRRTLTGKQERFCLLIVKGETQSKAYELAGYAVSTRQANDVNASKLLSSPKVKARVQELQRYAAQKALISVEMLTERLLEVDRAATEDKQHSAATGALALVARLHGLITDHKHVDIVHHKPSPISTKLLELTEDEWRRQFEKKK